ncbi:MAG: GNAT family N-acetyltransferase [Planctomycetota bacterium]|jgi:GNAT superfamily N-acetyltransferase
MKNMKVKIRMTQPDDAPAIATLLAELGYPTPLEAVSSRLAELGQSKDHAFFVADTEEGETVAWLHVFARRLVISHPLAEVGGVVVSKRHRRQGIGNRMIAATEKWAKDNGLFDLIVRSDTRREKAHDFYPSIGFVDLKKQSVYIKSLVFCTG